MLTDMSRCHVYQTGCLRCCRFSSEVSSKLHKSRYKWLKQYHLYAKGNRRNRMSFSCTWPVIFLGSVFFSQGLRILSFLPYIVKWVCLTLICVSRLLLLDDGIERMLVLRGNWSPRTEPSRSPSRKQCLRKWSVLRSWNMIWLSDAREGWVDKGMPCLPVSTCVILALLHLCCRRNWNLWVPSSNPERFLF